MHVYYIHRSGVEMTTVQANIGARENDYESMPVTLSINASPEEKVKYRSRVILHSTIASHA